MVAQDVVVRGGVARKALESRVGRVNGSVVRREQREALVSNVEDIEQWDIASLVRRRVVVADLRVVKKRLERGQRVVVRRDRVLKVLGHLEDVVDDPDGEVADSGDVDDRGVVLLVQNVRLAVVADGPGDDLRTTTLEVDGHGVVVEGLTEGIVGVCGQCVGEVARNDVVGEHVGEGGGVAREVARSLRPCT